jgi:hypothetical protein
MSRTVRPGEAGRSELPAERAKHAEVEAFLQAAARVPAYRDAKPVRATQPKGRLIFALDATASRQPTWDQACDIQGEMFAATASLGGLAVQLAYFRGMDEFHATPWANDSRSLIDYMAHVRCLRGLTQIERVLAHAVEEAKRQRINALVYVGDSMEELPDGLKALAGELGLLGVPVFIFHEGDDPIAADIFRHIARLTRGAYLSFDSSSPRLLRDLLAAIAIYAVGGHAALRDFSRTASEEVRRLTHQLR